tara:strand:- start:54785 stop:55534 length:750 start_codon:yes stop_codon:yes gene_type:complete
MKLSKTLPLVILLTSALFIQNSFAQVGIGTPNPDASSVLDVTSTTKGVLMARMTTAQRDAIVMPANGLVIYNTDSDEFQFNTNTSATPIWRALSYSAVSTATPGDSIKYSNSDTTTDVNPDTAITLPLFGNLLWSDNGTLYVVSGNQVTITEAGRYEFIVNVSLANATGTDRNAPEIRLNVNGTPVGTYGSTGYMRGTNGHESSSLHIREIMEINANDVITVSIVREGNNGAVNLRSVGTSNFYVEKIF